MERPLPPCGCGALALQILRGILVERPLPPLWCGALALQILRGILSEIWALMGCRPPPRGGMGTIPSYPGGGACKPQTWDIYVPGFVAPPPGRVLWSCCPCRC